ncbi:MAG: hypothetical protein ACHREM_23725 [Polyangiales bacterium]
MLIAIAPAMAFTWRTHADDAGVDGGLPDDAGASDAGTPLPPCFDSTARPNPIHVAGGDTPLISALAKLLAKDATPESIINGPGPSCFALADLQSHKKRTGTATYFDASGTGVKCALDPGGNEVDVAFSDSFASSCGVDVGTDIGDFFGPITPQLFVVPVASTQMAISAEAAYDAFGVNDGRARPWIDPHFFAVRDAPSGTQQVISSFIGVPGDQWWGQAPVGGGQIIAQLTAPMSAGDAEKSIGTLTTEDCQVPAIYPQLRILAFQAQGQSAAYWPDSTVRARDKRNVRDGHYAMWGPLHLFAHVVGGGPAITAAPLVTRFSQVALDKSVLDAEIDNFFVPQCAMRVRRTSEGGPLSAYAPAPACGCYFDARANSATSCLACSTDADCASATPRCNYGYCEVR